MTTRRNRTAVPGCPAAPLGVGAPGSGQIQASVNAGVPARGGTGEVDSDLGVLDPPSGAGVLPLNADGVPPFFRSPVLSTSSTAWASARCSRTNVRRSSRTRSAPHRAHSGPPRHTPMSHVLVPEPASWLGHADGAVRRLDPTVEDELARLPPKSVNWRPGSSCSGSGISGNPRASERMAQKVRRQEQGHEYAEKVLLRLGVPPLRAGVDPKAWLREALETVGARKLRHHGVHRFCGQLRRVATRPTPLSDRRDAGVARAYCGRAIRKTSSAWSSCSTVSFPCST